MKRIVVLSGVVAVALFLNLNLPHVRGGEVELVFYGLNGVALSEEVDAFFSDGGRNPVQVTIGGRRQFNALRQTTSLVFSIDPADLQTAIPGTSGVLDKTVTIQLRRSAEAGITNTLRGVIATAPVRQVIHVAVPKQTEMSYGYSYYPERKRCFHRLRR